MIIRHSAILLVILAVICSFTVIAQDIAIFRWVDENNVVHFSQHQPQDDNYSQLTTFSSYQSSAVKTIDDRYPLPPVDEQLTKYEQEQAAIKTQNQVNIEKNCKAAQLNTKMLNSFEQVMTTDSEGRNRLLTAEEKQVQLELSKRHTELYCKNS